MLTLQDLLGEVPMPPPAADYRDASDALVAAICKAATRDPQHFFSVLQREHSLLRMGDVVWAIGQLRDARAIPFLLAVLADKRSPVRWQAACGLATRREAEVVPGLVGALRDRSPTVRAVVIKALGKYGGKSALAPLREARARPGNAKDAYLTELIDAAIDRLESRR